jgi:hypothetical protein
MTPTAEGGHMGWVKLDEGFAEHPKLARVGAIGTWIQVQALCYAHRNLTDGFIPWTVARAFVARGLEYVDAAGQRWTLAVTSGSHGRELGEIDWLATLVDAGIWSQVVGGYQIHDYTHYQPTRAQVLAERADWTTGQRRRPVDPARAESPCSGSLFPPNPPIPSRHSNRGTDLRSGSGEDPDLTRARAKQVPRQATRWPADFTLTTERHALGREIGVEMPWEWNKFKDYHQAKGSRFCNWDAAWRAWLRNAIDYQQRRGRG